MSREPSMEEILSSIRRVIARDEPVQPPVQPVESTDSSGGATLRAVATTPSLDDDVLDLTMTTDDNDDHVSDSDTAGPAPVAAVEPANPLVAPESAAASRSSLETLAAMLENVAEPHPAPAIDSQLTVNAMVEAALRPMLKDWLDANLPAVVERLVSREIARITGSRL